MSEDRGNQKHRWLRRIAFTALALFLTWLAAGFYLFVALPLPVATSETTVDAVVVLGGASRERLPVGMQAFRDAQAPTLVLSSSGTAGNASMDSWCEAGPPVPENVVCFTPTPNNTSGEAQQIGALAQERGWRSIMIVTSRYHEARAAMLISQCTDATLIANPSEPDFSLSDWAQRFVQESAGIVAGFISPAC